MENHVEYEIHQNDAKYILSMDIANNILQINCYDTNNPNNKGYFAQYQHEQLKEFSPAFNLTKSIDEDFELFKTCIEHENINIIHHNNSLYITFRFESEENIPSNMNNNANLHLVPNPTSITNLPTTVEVSTPRYLPTIHIRLPTETIRRTTIYLNSNEEVIPSEKKVNNSDLLTNSLNVNSPKREKNNINNNNTTFIRQKKIITSNPSTPQKNNFSQYEDNYNSPFNSPKRIQQIQYENYGPPSKNKFK